MIAQTERKKEAGGRRSEVGPAGAKEVAINEHGVAVGFETLKPPLAENLGVRVTIKLGWFPAKDHLPPAWRAAYDYSDGAHGQSHPLSWRCAPYVFRADAVSDAVETVINLIVDDADRSRPKRAKELKAAVESLKRWQSSVALFDLEAKSLKVRTDRAAVAPNPAAGLFDHRGKSPKHRTDRSTAAAVIDVPSIPAEKLSTEERRELRQLEKEIERGARAWVEMANGLVEISDKRLWRETHASFDAWIESRRIDRSVAYRMMQALRIRRQIEALKTAVPAIELDRESQYRPFPADIDRNDLVAIVKRVARKIEPDADGIRRPTAKAIRAAIHEETTSPDDLRAERRKEGKLRIADCKVKPEAASRTPAAVSPSGDGDRPAAEVPSDDRIYGLKLLGGLPEDGSNPDYWNGQPNGSARQLRGLAVWLRRAIQENFPKAEETDDLARPHLISLLRSIASGIEYCKFPRDVFAAVPTHSTRRAK